jgi:outer membrane protein
LRQAEEGIAYQVTDARRKALEAEEKIIAREAGLAQAQEAQRLVKKRYENGMATLDRTIWRAGATRQGQRRSGRFPL